MNQHQIALAAFERGENQQALELLEALLQTEPSSELWNDWATVQAACGELARAEAGLLRALSLNSGNFQASMNLGLLLISRGEFERGIRLLEQASPALPEEEKGLVLATISAARERMRADLPKASEILVIHDTVTAGKDSLQARPLPLVQALCKLGHRVTLIVRDDRNRSEWDDALKRSGTDCFCGDANRLQVLGREITPGNWSLKQILETHHFALALLTQNFNHGFSIPEHYLDEIRLHSPATRIAIVNDELSSVHAARAFEKTGELRQHEIAENLKQREAEAFSRADLVVVPDEEFSHSLKRECPDTEIVVIGRDPSKMLEELPRLFERARNLSPKPQAAGPFSATLVDVVFASLLNTASGEKRVYARLDFYIQFGEQLLRQDQPAFAREQIRHIFGWLGGSIKLAPALAHPLGLLKRCYRTLGDDVMAERCAEEARRCFTASAPIETARPTDHSKAEFEFSLIVPTFNRLPILKKCLAALEKQTISLDAFEVIVIDDGSSDGTQEFMRGYQSPFQTQYLRQKNSGTGAARQNGVGQASGEYLLLMNDDTIFEPGTLEEHRRAQAKYSTHRWAVLGNFEYPAEARQRALTHFFRVNSFMFPQVDMAEGCPYGYSHFITCNLSIRREAILQVGSFDSTYKLSEDTEMGIRLFELGYGIVYHPAAHAWHDHLPYAVANLIRRARVYGADYFYMFRNHPRVMQEWGMPIRLQGMNERDAGLIQDYLEKNRLDVEAAVVALEKWDSVDFEPILANPAEAKHVLSLFQQAVPAIHWFYLFESMLQTMQKELSLPQAAPRMAMAARQGS